MAETVPIRIDELLHAFLNTTLYNTAYLHLVTGRIIFHNPREKTPEQNTEVEETVFSDEDWVELPYMESDEEHAEMLEFASTFPDESTKSKLMSALRAEKPFRQFRAVLTANHKVEKRWQIARIELAIRRSVEFCEALDIIPDDIAWTNIMVAVQSGQTHEEARQWLTKLPSAPIKKRHFRPRKKQLKAKK